MAWEPDYASVEELADQARIGDTVDNLWLQLCVSASSRAIDRATNRQFGATEAPETRTYPAKWSRTHGLYLSDVDDIQDDTGLAITVDGSALTSTQWKWIAPLNAAQRGLPWTRVAVTSATSTTVGSGPPTIDVAVDSFGWTAVPPTIKNATLLQAGRLVKRRDAPFGIAGSPDSGSEMRLLAKVDPDVELVLLPFRRNKPMVG